jgi:pyruvate dehydrogenase E2 component (dihydrolipoamide acetyltransferase)
VDCIIHMPDLGETAAEHQLVGWLVRVGDWVKVNQPLAEVEAEKGVREVPSPVAGRVVRLHAQPGQKLTAGQELATIDTLEETTA